MKKMLINATQKEELRVALVDGQTVYDLDIESVNSKQKKANIYKGVITRVEPSLEATFVDYGQDRHGFLPIKEIRKEYYSKKVNQGKGRPDYKKLIPEGTEVIVQVEKEERGNKGAALTTYISIAGRYLVLVPDSVRGPGISRQIQGEDRTIIKNSLRELDNPENYGVIVRTAGIGRSTEELQWDLNQQVRLWSKIEAAYKTSKAGTLLYQDNNLIVRAIRDHLKDDISQILIDNEKVFNQAYAFMSLVMPDKVNLLSSYQDEVPLFSRYQIEEQIDSAYGRSVRLPSGGELVIDYTEAMVSIDINSARSTKGANVEQTALHTNLEAAEEIARQLRLRDIGGLIVIDFIDMYEFKHRSLVERKIRDSIRLDRARVQTAKISKFGLLEMSRQRLRPSIDEASHNLCPRCKGQGSIRSNQSVALSVLRLIEEDAVKDNTAKVITQLPITVATFLLNEKRVQISDIEARNNVKVVIIANGTLETPHFDIIRVRDTDEENAEKQLSYKMVRDFTKSQETSSQAESAPLKPIQEAVVSNIPSKIVAPIEIKKEDKIEETGFFSFFKKIFHKNLAETEQTVVSKDRNDNRNDKKQTRNRPPRNKQQNNNSKQGQNKNNNQQQTKQNLTGQQADKQQKRKQPYNKNKTNAKPNSNTNSNENNKSNANNTNNKTNNRGNKNTKQVKNNRPPKKFVNKYISDQTKVQDGRPVSNDAQRGAGKFDADVNLNLNSTQSSNKLEQGKSINKNTKSADKSVDKVTPKKNQNQNPNSVKAENSDHVWIPHAVKSAVGVWYMGDDLEMETQKVDTNRVGKEKTKPTNIENKKEEKMNTTKKQTKIAELSSFGQSIWFDNISRDMIESKDLEKLIAKDDLRGITSNPAIFEKAIASNHPSYLEQIAKVKEKTTNLEEIFFELASKDISDACDLMLETYNRTDKTDGMVSLEVSPNIAYDADKTIAQAIELSKKLSKKNLMIKVPATKEGLVAIEKLTSLGININVTLLFSVSRYVEVFKAYIRGLKSRSDMGLDISEIRSVASFFISRIDATIDPLLAESKPEFKGKVAISAAKLAYKEYLNILKTDGWKELEGKGAKAQRLLWASTSTKDPSYSDVLYINELIGKETVNTIPPATYDAFNDHGEISMTITKGLKEAQTIIKSLPDLGIDLGQVAQKLEDAGVKGFEKSFETLLKALAEKI